MHSYKRVNVAPALTQSTATVASSDTKLYYTF
jgi:hypothetical protein